MRFHQLHNTTCEEHNPGKSLPNPITLLATFEDLKKQGEQVPRSLTLLASLLPKEGWFL